MSTNAKTKSGFLDRFQSAIEKGANKLPPPFILFFYLFMITAVLSLILSLCGVELLNPSNGEIVKPNNFFSIAGIHWLLANMVKNFTGYASLGVVVTMTVGMGMLEQTGMVSALLKKLMAIIPDWALVYGCAVIAICGNIFSDSSGYIIPPLIAMLFASYGKNPIAGFSVGMLGTSGGWSANLFPAGTDALLMGITNTVLDSELGAGVLNVDLVCNYFFTFASTFILAAVITLVDKYIMEPHLGPYVPGKGKSPNAAVLTSEISDTERKGLRAAGIVALGYAALILVGIFTGVLTNQETGSLLNSPFLSGIVPILFGLFFTSGLAFAKATGNVKTSKDISDRCIAQVKTMTTFITLVFVIGQFSALFSWTKIGTILSIAGANALQTMGFTGYPMIIIFILIVACINFLVGSSSTKWAILGPIFIPMMLQLGYHPAFIQMAYRIGDSCTNACSPMSAVLFMCLGIAQEQYDKDCQLGTILSNNILGAFCMLGAWIVFFLIWNLLGIPVGPGITVHLPAGIL